MHANSIYWICIHRFQPAMESCQLTISNDSRCVQHNGRPIFMSQLCCLTTHIQSDILMAIAFPTKNNSSGAVCQSCLYTRNIICHHCNIAPLGGRPYNISGLGFGLSAKQFLLNIGNALTDIFGCLTRTLSCLLLKIGQALIFQLLYSLATRLVNLANRNHNLTCNIYSQLLQMENTAAQTAQLFFYYFPV